MMSLLADDARVYVHSVCVSVSRVAPPLTAGGPSRVCSCVIPSDLKLGVGFEAADGR